MAAFDPDAYLAQKPAAAPAGPAAFDPDAYLRSREVPQVDAAGRVMQDAIPAPRRRGFVEEYLAPIVEVPGTIATGLVATVPATAALIANLPKGRPAAERAFFETAERLTYKPSSETSQEILGGLGKAVQESKIAPVMPGMGAPGAVRAGARAVAAPIKAETELVTEAVKTAQSKRAAKVAETRMAQSYERGPQIDAAKEANRLGIALDPAISNPTRANKLRALVADPTEVHNVLSEMNVPKYNQIAKREMGLPPSAQLTSSAPFDEARAAISAPYNEIKKLGALSVSDDILAKIRGLEEESLISSAAAGGKVAPILERASEKLAAGMSGEDAIRNLTDLRKRAKRVYNSASPTEEALDVADAYLGIANAIEDAIASNVTDRKLLSQFQKARTEMAKIYGYENATDFRTGRVDIQKLARQVEKNPNMTGDIAALGRIAANFPEVTGMKPTELSLMQRFTRAGAAGTVGAGLGGAIAGGPGVILGGALGAMTGKLGGRYAARRLGVPEVQAARAVPSDYRPPVNMLRPAEAQYTSTQPVLYDWRNALLTEEQIPNWVYGRPEADVRAGIMPGPAALEAPSPEATMRGVRGRSAFDYAMEKTLAEEAERRAAAQAATTRQPAGAGMVYELDPTTGRLQPVSRGIPGATPEVMESAGKTLESAAQKLSSGRAFAMTADEKIAWGKTKVDLSVVDPKFEKLSDKQIAEKMMDRQWVAAALQKAKDQAKAFAEIEARAADAQARFNAAQQRQKLMDIAESLEERLRGPRAGTQPKEQGPKTRAAKKNNLAPESKNNLME